MTVGRRLAAALEAAATDPGAWPLGMLGFLVRGGIVVLAVPILTLPSPVGLATMLGPAVISTGRLEGPLRSLIIVSGGALAVIVAVAVLLGAAVEHAVHARRRLGRPIHARHTVPRLVAVELLALAPLAMTLAAATPVVVDELRRELLLPGDLAVPFVVRVVAHAALPLGLLAAASVVAEAIDGTVSRRILVADRLTRPPWRDLLTVIGTATVGWLVTLVGLLPGLVIIGATWEAARTAWSRLAGADPTSPDVALAIVAAVAMVAVWATVLLLCGIASILRANLWTSRVGTPGDWTGVGH